MAADKTVLVTGAGGFVGRALCRELLARGFAVVAASRQVQGVGGTRHFQVGELDGSTDWSPALEGVTAIVHCAARAHIVGDKTGDLAAVYRRTNCLATLALARQARQAGVRRLVFISSVKVNGEGRDRPYTEADAPAPVDAYGVSKADAERGLAEIASEGLETVVLRPPLVYGPGVRANFLRLMRLVDRGLPVPLGSIHNRRSMLYVGNLTSAIGTALDHPATGTFLLSDNDDLSTTELLRRLATALGRPARLLPAPAGVLRAVARFAGRGAEAQRLLGSLTVDGSAFRNAFAWSPPFDVDAGLAETARWYRAQKVARDGDS